MESATTQNVKDQVQEAGDQVRDKAQQAGEQARGRVQQEIDQRSTQAGESLGSTAQTVRRVSESLREEGQDGPARAAEQAAERIDKAGQWMRDSDADRIVRDVERFGREKPWAFALGGMALGFAAARFLKASSGERYRQEASAPPQTGNGYQPSPGLSELPPTAAAAGTAPTTPLDPPASG